MRIHHVALRVSDLDACRRFYCDGLGLEVVAERESSLWLRVGDAVLMLEHRLRGAGPDEGSGHVLALAVDSLDEWEERLAAAAIPIDDRTPQTLFLRDPEGHRVGLSVYPCERGSIRSRFGAPGIPEKRFPPRRAVGE